MKERTVGVSALIGLTGAYLTIRYALLFLHGMKQWPFALFVVGFVIISLSGLVFNGKFLPILTLIGYAAGFVIGCIFQSDYGIGLNNLWIIWTGVYLISVLIGIVEEIFYKRRKAN